MCSKTYFYFFLIFGKEFLHFLLELELIRLIFIRQYDDYILLKDIHYFVFSPTLTFNSNKIHYIVYFFCFLCITHFYFTGCVSLNVFTISNLLKEKHVFITGGKSHNCPILTFPDNPQTKFTQEKYKKTCFIFNTNTEGHIFYF